MTLKCARLRSVHGGEVVELDVILCKEEEWVSASLRRPDLAAWRTALFPGGYIVAVEPAPGPLLRIRDMQVERDGVA